jgi:hypothetical protein
MDTRENTFRYAAYLYAAGTLLHTLDHFRRGVHTVSDGVVFLGTFGMVFAAVAITLCLTNHPFAPKAALYGFPHAIGIAAIHYLPHWSSLSDSAFGGNWSPISWFAVSIEIIGALAFGFAGLALLRRERTPQYA